MIIREERQGDEARIRGVNVAAFEKSLEADLVDALRRQATPLVSLVAEDDANVIGHILFSPVTLASDPRLILMGLAPMAVVPSRQRQGVGSTLVREGLERCRQLNVAAVVVLGHSEYYPRFGFLPAVRLSLRSEYDVPEEVFMVRELRDGVFRGLSGTIRYHPVFGTSSPAFGHRLSPVDVLIRFSRPGSSADAAQIRRLQRSSQRAKVRTKGKGQRST